MRYREFGGTRLPGIGLGTMGLGGRFSADPADDANALQVLRQALDCGLTFIDTAEVYAAGHCEELIGRAIRGRRDEVFLASKVSPEHFRTADIQHACERSLARLATDRLDLYQLHWPNPAVPIEESLGAMRLLQSAGKIVRIGLSNYSTDEVKYAKEVLAPDLFSVQVEYNLCERSVESDLLPYCASQGMLLIAYSPLDQGSVASDARVRGVLDEVGRSCAKTGAQVALNFLATQGPVLPIPKARSPVHLAENAAAGDFELPDTLRARVDCECRVPVTPIPWTEVDPSDGRGGVATLEAALENRMGFTPPPSSLAEAIRLDDRVKPVRVRLAVGPGGAHRYVLEEGRLRFWAWVIAFDGRRPVPAVVRS